MTSPARARVLVVEDKPHMLGLVAKILGEQHAVTTAQDGAQALALIASTEFDVVMTDVRMPGADGFEVVRAIKKRWPATEVVMMTAFASIEAAVAAIREGAYDYIQKPFDPDDLTLVVARALERRRASRATGVPGGDAASGLHAVPRLADAEELASLTYRDVVSQARDRITKEYLAALLRALGGNVTKAADRAGLERESLHRLLKRYGLRADAFREPGGGGDKE